VGPVELLVTLVLFGGYYAATDGVLMALASEVLAPEIRTSGMAMLTTATGISALFASLIFGTVWTIWGAEVATILFLVGLALALVVAGVLFAQRDHAIHQHSDALSTF
jgi:MFS family permease